ncbi:MAG: DHHA1 domain-containing protein [Vulcanimicrobiota bacterium]
MTFTHILYHANCADGFGAAYSAWLILGDQAEYLPVRHGDPPPELPSSARVAIVDFSYDRDTLLKMHAQVEGFMVLDHHKSAQDELKMLEWARFDMAKSGARLAWEYWHPSKELPELLAYVEDRDLWRWALPESRELSLALQCYPQDFQTWSQLSVAELRAEGRAILSFQNQQITRAVSRARLLELAGHTVPVVNSCLFQSEIGDELCRSYPEAPFSAVYYVNQHGKEAWSLRSIGSFDVAEVARGFGGGGHRNAAGFGKEL